MEDTNSPSSDQSAYSEAALLTEYEALRGEILLRIGLRDQMMNYAVTLFGACIAVSAYAGTQADTMLTALVLLAYPVCAVSFARGWRAHDLRIYEIGTFLRDKCEPHMKGACWEKYLWEVLHPEHGTGAEQEYRASGKISLSARLVFMITMSISILGGSALAMRPLHSGSRSFSDYLLTLFAFTLFLIDIGACRMAWDLLTIDFKKSSPLARGR